MVPLLHIVQQTYVTQFSSGIVFHAVTKFCAVMSKGKGKLHHRKLCDGETIILKLWSVGQYQTRICLGFSAIPAITALDTFKTKNFLKIEFDF